MFDEQPDSDLHGECAAEIHRLEAHRDRLLEALKAVLREPVAYDMLGKVIQDTSARANASAIIAEIEGEKG